MVKPSFTANKLADIISIVASALTIGSVAISFSSPLLFSTATMPDVDLGGQGFILRVMLTFLAFLALGWTSSVIVHALCRTVTSQGSNIARKASADRANWISSTAAVFLGIVVVLTISILTPGQGVEAISQLILFWVFGIGILLSVLNFRCRADVLKASNEKIFIISNFVFFLVISALLTLIMFLFGE
ncbi:MAG: hypothetical protein AAGF25_13610 [Pseudomonadota bacterium]